MNSSTIHQRFIEPLDVLFLRGNKLFGDPGSFGESLVPPWPSVAAGALRSAMLAREGVDLVAFARGAISHPTLGTPQQPGSFSLQAFTLARRLKEGGVETLHTLPADLVAHAPAEVDAGEADGLVTVRRVQPTAPHAALMSSAPSSRWPVLPQASRAKAASGYWLTQAGWARYLQGETPSGAHLVHTSALWGLDHRVGVGLDAAARRAADGQLFSVQAVAFHAGVGFVASVAGAVPPADGVLRLGGDGRGAAVTALAHAPATVNLAAIVQARRARLVLTTPALFDSGWRLPLVDNDGLLNWPGLRARVVCAAVPRAETLSGWNLAKALPKDAERAAPTGSVYWLDDIETTPEALGKLAETGLWLGDSHNVQRRAEGFNRFTFAAW